MTTTHQHQNASLYVGDLNPDVTEAMLFDGFKAVGPVLSIRVCRDAVTRRSLGYAYVNFQNPNDAERALETLNYQSIKGRNIRIMWSQRDPSLRKSGSGNIFIKNLHPSIDSQTLYDTFSQFGNILSCKLVTNPSTKEPRGYGFVHFESEESAKAAIERVNGMLLKSLLVYVGHFVRSSQRRQASEANFTNVYFKDLKAEITKEELESFLKNNIDNENPITDSYLGTDSKGRPWACVNFANHEIAVDIIQKLNGKKDSEIGNENLFLARHQKKKERLHELSKSFNQRRRTNEYLASNLYVKNLDDTINDQTLRDAFSRFGEISSSKVMLDDKNPPQSKGFGFVCFKDVESANKAITEMSGQMLGQKPLYVSVAQRKEVRRATLEIQYASRARPPVQPQVPGYGFPPQNVYPPPFFGTGPGYFPNIPGRGMLPPKGWPTAFPGGPIQGGPPGGMPMGRGVPGAGARGRGAPQSGGRGVAGPRGGMPARGGGAPKNAAAPGPYPFNQPPVQGVVKPATTDLASQLSALSPVEQKNFLGEKLFNKINSIDPERSAKITGMLLEMDLSETITLLEAPHDILLGKVNEAVEVLKAHEATGQ